jgi:hypothetical protein
VGSATIILELAGEEYEVRGTFHGRDSDPDLTYIEGARLVQTLGSYHPVAIDLALVHELLVETGRFDRVGARNHIESLLHEAYEPAEYWR